MLASPILSPASSTRSLPSRFPSSRRGMVLQPQVSIRERVGVLHVFMGFLMSIIGAGMMSVPYTLVIIPMWEALAGIAFVGTAMACTANAMLHAHVHAAARAEFEDHTLGAGSKFVGFQALAIRAGGPALGYAVSVVVASGVYGGCVGNLQIIRDLTPFVMQLVYGGVTNLSDDAQEHVKQVVVWGLLAVVLLPLCMFRSLSALQPTNYVSFALALYLVGAVVYRSFDGYAPDVTTGTLPLNNTGGSMVSGSMELEQLRIISNGLNSSSASFGGDKIAVPNPAASTTEASTLDGNSLTRLAQSISIYNFAFMMTLNLLPLFMQLLTANGGDTTSRRGGSMRSLTSLVAAPLLTARSQMTWCIFGASFASIVLYGAIGYAAYDLYGDTIDGNILLNLQSDPVMQIPLLAMYVTILFTFPLLFLPLRSLVEEMLGKSFQAMQLSPGIESFDIECGEFPDEPIYDDKRRCLPADHRFTRLAVVLLLLCSQQLIALNVSGIEVVFSLLGATSCLVICYVFPVIAFTAVYPWHRMRRGVIWLGFLWTIVCIVTIQGITCVWLLVSSQ